MRAFQQLRARNWFHRVTVGKIATHDLAYFRDIPFRDMAQGGEQGEVLGESEESGGGAGGTSAPTSGVAGTVTEATATSSLPFTGGHVPLLLLSAAGLLCAGFGLRRATAQGG